jgi:small subunit ribosomal protein S17
LASGSASASKRKNRRDKEQRMPKRILQGTVVSDVSDKTVIVRVERRVMHPVYKKYVLSSKKYAAHDEDNRYRNGDTVRIEESRPLSKRKHWVVIGGPVEAAPGRRARAVAPDATETAMAEAGDAA